MKHDKWLLSCVFFLFAHLGISNIGMPSDDMAAMSIGTGKNQLCIDVISSGEYATTSWKSELKISRIDGGSKHIVYRKSVENPIQQIELLPKAALIDKETGNQSVTIFYIIRSDGLDPDRIFMLLSFDGKIYENIAKLTKSESSQNTFEAMSFNSGLSGIWLKLAQQQWKIFRENNDANQL